MLDKIILLYFWKKILRAKNTQLLGIEIDILIGNDSLNRTPSKNPSPFISTDQWGKKNTAIEKN